MICETQRRAAIRGLFWLLCVLPTVATVAWAYTRHGNARRDEWRRELSAALGLRADIAAVHNPRPGVLQFEGLRCYDAETDSIVLECRSVEIETSGQGWRIVASQPEIFADSGERLFAALERRLRGEQPDSESPLELSAAELTWHAGGQSQTLRNVEAVTGIVETGRRLLVNFELPGVEADQPASLQVSRKPQSGTLIEFDTGRAAVPCQLLGPLSDVAGVLGAQSRFEGRLKLRQSVEGWEGVVAGSATEVDFQRLVGSRSPFQIWAGGEAHIHWAEFKHGRIERMQGTILAGPGQISGRLIAAACEHLGLGDADVELPPGSETLFDRLEFDFALDAGGLSIQSRSAERSNAVLWKGDAVYWRAPQAPSQPVAHLLRALQPDRALLAPASPELAELVARLPKPAAVDAPPVPQQGTLAPPRVRLREPTP